MTVDVTDVLSSVRASPRRLSTAPARTTAMTSSLPPVSLGGVRLHHRPGRRFDRHQHGDRDPELDRVHGDPPIHVHRHQHGRARRDHRHRRLRRRGATHNGTVSDDDDVRRLHHNFACPTNETLYTDGHYEDTRPNTARIVETTTTRTRSPSTSTATSRSIEKDAAGSLHRTASTGRSRSQSIRTSTRCWLARTTTRPTRSPSTRRSPTRTSTWPARSRSPTRAQRTT